ncbi:dihydrolipoamide dehydrogenase [Kiloniella litopenaei]|uniref:Dihydrolipoyl dehydrogenase n=1 Tax=Kiloniella litopenaei TaxID=1549748 RepID=A0A0M2R658_9PROT|nr:dihydrolipoyl dehydrogenase [Kiloniella litopenaei]KKJ75495.1 dihydrolipoamide dehydrogenase [Kiloniella litopenaei]
MSDTNFDVIVLGGGPGGYVTAIRSAQLGLKTAVVEKDHLGGICLNWGCIPTKALLRSAEIYRNMKHAEDYGLSASNVSFDLQKIVERSKGVSKQLNGGVGHLLKKNKVTVFDGTGTLTAAGKMTVEGKDKKKTALTAKNIIIATGARARTLPGLEPDGKLVWTYREALRPDTMPKSLLVVGSGAIGIEFADFYSTLGADVTVVEIFDKILPVEDDEISKLAQKQLGKHGLKFRTGTKVSKLDKKANQVTATLEKNGKTEQITVDRVISAVGVVGNIENLGLEALGIKTDRGCIVTDEFSRTNVPGVYAIGDVAGPPMLAHKAEHEGVVCIEKIAGLSAHPIDKSKIPGCTYCHPQIASVGLNEQTAKAEGRDVKIGRFPFAGNGKAIALGEAEGLIKTIFDAKTGELLGAHMIGAEVTELIQGFVVAMGLETTEEELMHTVFPHPTLSEMMHESVLDAYGRAIHF